MMTEKKYALLDTDFISKSHLARNGDTPLADLILNFDGYKFFCHKKITEELERHSDWPEPLEWLRNHIADGKITLYTDAMIIEKLREYSLDSAWNGYLTMLRKSCDAFGSDFFPKYYGRLAGGKSADGSPYSNAAFLNDLMACDAEIPTHSSMGEKKTYALIQMMQFLHPGQVCVFCSDDSRARHNVVFINSDVSDVKCFSILAAFRKIHLGGLNDDILRKYYESYTSFLRENGQDTFRVWRTNSQMERVPAEQVFEDIVRDRFILLSNGDLKYIS